MTEEQFTDDQGNIITKKVSDQRQDLGEDKPQPFSSPPSPEPGPCRAVSSRCLRLQSRRFSSPCDRQSCTPRAV